MWKVLNVAMLQSCKVAKCTSHLLGTLASPIFFALLKELLTLGRSASRRVTLATEETQETGNKIFVFTYPIAKLTQLNDSRKILVSEQVHLRQCERPQIMHSKLRVSERRVESHSNYPER